MSVEEKWADRIYRAPKKGSDYTSTRVNVATGNRSRLPWDRRPSEIDEAQLQALRIELNDMQLVVNHLEQRVGQLEKLPQQQDQLIKLGKRIRRLEIFTLMLIVAFIIAVTLKILSGMGL
jgi:hypothetical protein